MQILKADTKSGVRLPDGGITTHRQLVLTRCHPDMSLRCPVSLTPANTHRSKTHAAHTHPIPARPSLTRHSSMPHRPIRRCLMRRSVTHLRMHDKVLLDFPVATVCSLFTSLNMQTHTRAHACTQMCYMSEDVTSAVVEGLRV